MAFTFPNNAKKKMTLLLTVSAYFFTSKNSLPTVVILSQKVYWLYVPAYKHDVKVASICLRGAT